LGDEGAKLIAETLPKMITIVALDLTSNSIGPVGGAAIINSLTDNQSLIELNLSSAEGQVGRNTLGPVGVKSLQNVLACNQFLTILNVSGNFIGD
jgi:NLR family CARD domain-containing protein 3